MTSSKKYTITFDDLSLAQIHYWSSDWGTEWTPHHMSAELPLEIGVTAGRSSKGHHPFISIEDGSSAHFLAVAWSGNWQISCTPHLRSIEILVKTDCDQTHLITKTVNSGGIDAAMREFIADFREFDTHGTPKLLTEWNSWWPYEDTDINEETLLANALRAKEAGIEVAVLDAGWFGPAAKDSHWHHLRGDWDQRNIERFPSGLRGIADAVRKLGIEFGIWLEIEALGEKAQLAKIHPEFIAEHNGRNLQYVCLGNPDAFSWALNTSKSLVEECGASWIKMDFNVDPGAGCNRADHGHDSSLGLNAHLHNLYALLDTLKKDYPNLTVENCSSGGLRWDLAMASHVDVGFASDPDWPEHALSCFWAASLFFPPEKLLGWCDSQWRGENGHQLFTALESSDADLEFALSITLLGGFGISARLPDFSESKMQLVTRFVSIYKKFFRPRFQNSPYINHLTPQPERDLKGSRIVAFAIENETQSPLLAIYQLDGGSTQAVITYLPPKPEAFYQIRNLVSDETLFLSHQGTLTVQNTLKDNCAMILIFEEISS
jgi:alpha-galactosidase